MSYQEYLLPDGRTVLVCCQCDQNIATPKVEKGKLWIKLLMRMYEGGRFLEGHCIQCNELHRIAIEDALKLLGEDVSNPEWDEENEDRLLGYTLFVAERLIW